MAIDRLFLRDIESTLRFEYQNGDITVVPPNYGEWRTLPTAVLSQVNRGSVRIGWEGGRSLVLQPGEAFYAAPGVRHKIDNEWPGTNLARWAHFNVWIFGSVDLITLLETPAVLSGEGALEAGDICAELSRLYALERPGLADMLRRQSHGYRLVELIAGAGRMEPRGQQLLPYLERLSPVLTYIHENLVQPLSREELANRLHLSPSRFFVLFKEALGVSPTEYIQAHRLQQAQRLLLNSEMSVSEAGARSGYPDEFHFSRLFRRRFGISPLQYRKQIVKNLHG